MCAGQRKGGHVVVKDHISISCWMTRQAGITIIDIAGHVLMIIIGFTLLMAGGTCKLSVVSWSCMTVHTVRPFSSMATTVDREVLTIMIEGRRNPTALCMTFLAFH
jgi:hypothetical protein